MKWMVTLTLSFMVVFTAATQAQVKFEDAVKKIEATVEPAEAKPGQTVTIKIKVELNEGWYTYPTMQTDPAARTQINKITFPESSSIIAVGTAIDPPGPKVRPEPDLSIEKLFYYPGTSVFEYKAVVSPRAEAGEAATTMKFLIMVCTKENCIKKPVELKAMLKIAGAPVVVEVKYQEEVEKALKK